MHLRRGFPRRPQQPPVPRRLPHGRLADRGGARRRLLVGHAVTLGSHRGRRGPEKGPAAGRGPRPGGPVPGSPDPARSAPRPVPWRRGHPARPGPCPPGAAAPASWQPGPASPHRRAGERDDGPPRRYLIRLYHDFFPRRLRRFLPATVTSWTVTYLWGPRHRRPGPG